MEIKNGFYTALGTSQDKDGLFLQKSFAQQVKDQTEFGAAGLLVMGSMGLGVFVRDRDYVKVAKTAISAARGACPVFIGVTDTTIGRTCDRIDALTGLDFDGVVATPPYYYAASEREQICYYGEIARRSPKPVFLYDLPSASRSKITLATIQGLHGEKNIGGIKTADLPLALELDQMVMRHELNAGFKVLYSGLDTFDLACNKGIGRNLDGMFACTGQLAHDQYQAFALGDITGGTKYLKQIIALRDVFAEEEIMPSFTYAMNLLGYEGYFHQDYCFMPSQKQCDKIVDTMKLFHLV
ncbi:MAG: dihydrodipicolinate synthase family protein [Clostridiaceae bacterium]|nr:dihydrodipicolinate synthase family protein [Clostridiaceae bacterium]